jgi:hypothetical protein
MNFEQLFSIRNPVSEDQNHLFLGEIRIIRAKIYKLCLQDEGYHIVYLSITVCPLTPERVARPRGIMN